MFQVVIGIIGTPFGLADISVVQWCPSVLGVVVVDPKGEQVYAFYPVSVIFCMHLYLKNVKERGLKIVHLPFSRFHLSYLSFPNRQLNHIVNGGAKGAIIFSKKSPMMSTLMLGIIQKPTTNNSMKMNTANRFLFMVPVF